MASGNTDRGQSVDLTPLPGSPLILGREEHNISRRNIDPDALKVMARLIRHGHRAFLVGGGVRDLLLGRTPKDFDIGTDARPENVRSLFRNSRIIGRRFRLNHVFFGGTKIFEVSTFRAGSGDDEVEPDGHVRSDNTYGDPQTDALRRDLTINGLFYDLSTFSVIDYVGGIADLRNGIIRIIGEADRRFMEDPVRMIRAVRHAARTGFEIEPVTFDSICRMNEVIKAASPARVFEELVREMQGGYAAQSFELLQKTGLLSHLIPAVSEAMKQSPQAATHLRGVLRRIDRYIQGGTEIPMSVVFLAITIGMLPEADLAASLSEKGLAEYFALIPGAERSLSAPDVEIGNELSDDDTAAHRSRGNSSTRSRSGSVPLTKLGDAVEKLYRPIGVPRKDRERMVSALRMRYELFRGFFENRKDKAHFGRRGFDDAMLLLDLIRGGEVTESCLRFWIAEGADESGDSEMQSPQKRRRRRRRRRRRNDVSSSNAAPSGEEGR